MPMMTAERPGTSREERMLAAAALIDQALLCLRSHPHEAELRLRDALQILGARKRSCEPVSGDEDRDGRPGRLSAGAPASPSERS